MTKSHRLFPAGMAPFSAAPQTDEGYSEDPLNPVLSQNPPAALMPLRSLKDLPSWLSTHASALPLSERSEMIMALLEHLPTCAVAEIVQRLSPRLYRDFMQFLPTEICLKILSNLDPTSLVNVMRTCRSWYSLAIDRKLWEKLYYREGWKAIHPEIDECEARFNFRLSKHRVLDIKSRSGQLKAVGKEDDDPGMTDNDHDPRQATHGPVSSFALFDESFPPRNLARTVAEDVEMTDSAVPGKSKAVDRDFPCLDHVVRVKRKEPDGSPEPSPSPVLPSGAVSDHPLRATLWIWDEGSRRYRANWKYLYNMRRRLESNWKLGKYKTFQLPHPLHPQEGHQEGIYTLQFDANFFVSGSRDQTIRIWDLHTRRLARPPLIGHQGSVLCLQFDADPAEDILVSGSSDSNIFIWKFSTGKLVHKITNAHRESVLNVRFDKRVLVTSSKDKTIKIFNRRPLRYGDLGYANEAMDTVGTEVKRYGFEPDPAQELPVTKPYSLIGLLVGHGAAVNAIQIRDKTIVSVSGDRQIKVWNWPDKVCTKTILAHDKGIACVEFDERRIVSGSSDYEVCIFDAPTGLKVAQLRGHKHLVRTVQAGFGDLPYSKEEDEVEARAIDAEYFRAVEAGEVGRDHDRWNCRPRAVNAGSSRPAEIQAYGAKVPPGGGGSRKYGRIVSGSYDQSIIIWRRDKEGVWRPAHYLRQEEAAAAAQRELTASFRTTGAQDASGAGVTPFSESQFQLGGGLPPLDFNHGAARQLPHDPHSFAALYMTLIDQVVPRGATALGQALECYPALLTYNTHLQAAIERESSPFTRAQLRQTVATARATIQDVQAATRAAGAANLTAPHPGPSGDGGLSLNEQGQTQIPGGAPLPVSAPTPPTQSTHGPGIRAQQTTATAAQNHSVTPLALHHPHIAAAENAPARVFKLQFDARKIVCCSQAPVIVGWDFCNGDAQLEETARFFATVD